NYLPTCRDGAEIPRKDAGKASETLEPLGDIREARDVEIVSATPHPPAANLSAVADPMPPAAPLIRIMRGWFASDTRSSAITFLPWVGTSTQRGRRPCQGRRRIPAGLLPDP